MPPPYPLPPRPNPLECVANTACYVAVEATFLSNVERSNMSESEWDARQSHGTCRDGAPVFIVKAAEINLNTEDEAAGGLPVIPELRAAKRAG